MVLHLVRDVLWRQRLVNLSMIVPVTAWAGISGGYLDVSYGLTFTLFFALIAGPGAAMLALSLREIRVLPIAERTLWRTAWTASTLTAVLWALATTGLGISLRLLFDGPIVMAIETPGLVAIYAFALAGVVVGLAPFVGYASHWATERRPRWLWTALAAAAFVSYFGTVFVAPYLLSKRLPIRVDQFTVPAIALIAAWVTLALMPLAWTPSIGGSFALAPPRLRPTSGGSSARPRFADRFTGVWRILWTQLAGTAIVGLTLAALLVGSVIAWPTRDRTAALEELLPIALVIVYMQHAWAPWARRIKTLPITSTGINALFLATSLGTWLIGASMVAGICIALHVEAGMLTTMPVIIAGGGFLALAHSLLLRFQSRPWVFVMMIGFLVPTSHRVMEGSSTFHLRLAVASMIALAVAAIINHHTLTRSTSASAAYQRTPQPFAGATPR